MQFEREFGIKQYAKKFEFENILNGSIVNDQLRVFRMDGARVAKDYAFGLGGVQIHPLLNTPTVNKHKILMELITTYDTVRWFRNDYVNRSVVCISDVETR